MIVINNNGIYGGLDDDLYKEITNDAEGPTSITRSVRFFLWVESKRDQRLDGRLWVTSLCIPSAGTV